MAKNIPLNLDGDGHKKLLMKELKKIHILYILLKKIDQGTKFIKMNLMANHWEIFGQI